MNERYHFILIVDINAVSVRVNEETTGKNKTSYFLPVFLVALLWSPSKKRDRKYTIDFTGKKTLNKWLE